MVEAPEAAAADETTDDDLGISTVPEIVPRRRNTIVFRRIGASRPVAYCQNCGQEFHSWHLKRFGQSGLFRTEAHLKHRCRRNVPGLRRCRYSQATHTTVSVVDTLEAGLDFKRGPYMAVCEDHGVREYFRVLEKARQAAVYPTFCSQCKDFMRAHGTMPL